MYSFPLQYFNGESSILRQTQGTQSHGENIQNSYNNCDELWGALGPFTPKLPMENPQHHQTLSKELIHHVELANHPPVHAPVQNSASLVPVQRKRTLWTEEEHRKFLLAVRKHGRGKLAEITKDVGTKTYSQVASHAQKYFKRQDAPPEKKKRKSIHDMILEDTNEVSYQIVVQNSSPDPALEHRYEAPHHIVQQNSTFDPVLKDINEVPHHIVYQNLTPGPDLHLLQIYEMQHRQEMLLAEKQIRFFFSK